MQRLLPPHLVGLLLVAMVSIALISPWPSLDWPVRLLGTLPFVTGAAITVRHARLFDRIGTNIKTFDDPDVLVSEGAFGWTRNPMYLGFLLILAGAGLALGSLASLAGPVVFFVAADRWYIPFEERRMAASFGNDYDEYMRIVHRWIGQRAS